MNKTLLFVFTFLCLYSYGQEPILEKVGEEVYKTFSSPHPYRGNVNANHQLVWRQNVHEKGAGYIAFHFSKIELEKDDYLIVRDPENTRFWKYSFEEVEIKNNSFWSIHIYGEDAVIEIFSRNPKGAFGYEIDKIAKGFTIDSLPRRVMDICGDDDSENAICYENTEPCVYEKSRTVARLLINGISACTGWLIGDEGHLITNQHCIGSQADANNTTFEFMAEGANCNSNCNTWLGCPGQIEATSATLIRVSTSLDYALVELPTNVSNTYGFLQLRASGAQLDERIYIPQHPMGWGKRIALFSDHPNDGGGFARVQSLTESGCSSSSYQDVGYFADTEGGSSGSPVIGYEDHLVVALHHCASCLNRAVPIQLIIQDLGGDLPNNALAPAMSGPDGSICSSATYSVSNLPTGSTVNWSVSPSGIVSMTTSGNSVILTRIGNGTLTLTADISGCFQNNLSKSIHAGVPVASELLIYGDGNGQFCSQWPPVAYGAFYGDLSTCSIERAPAGIIEVEWQITPGVFEQFIPNSGMGVCSTVDNSGVKIKVGTGGSPPPPPGIMLPLKIRARNACGWSGWSSPYMIQYMQCGPGFAVYPNPADNILKVSNRLDKEPPTFSASAGTSLVTEPSLPQDYQATLYNHEGKIMLHGDSKQGELEFNISSLIDGFYFLRINTGKEFIERKVIIQH